MYPQLQALRVIFIHPNPHDGRVFIKVVASDKKTYQVKFNAPGEKSNINEFISNHIGRLMRAPVLEAAFISFTENMLENIFEYIRQNFKVAKEIDMSCIKNNKFFGIEWKDSIIPLQTNDELEIFIKQTSNSDQFFSLYPFDQYLKNFDRHIGNHLIIKEENKKASQYTLIDGDRIFGSLQWDRISWFQKDFNCLKAQGANWHNYLYNLIDEATYNHILKYSLHIDTLKDSDVELMMQVIDHIYNINKEDYGNIFGYLKSRKDGFYAVCVNNATCFPNIKQTRGL